MKKKLYWKDQDLGPKKYLRKKFKLLEIKCYKKAKQFKFYKIVYYPQIHPQNIKVKKNKSKVLQKAILQISTHNMLNIFDRKGFWYLFLNY